MIDTRVLACVLYRHHLTDILHHADHSVIPTLVGTNVALFRIGNVVAGRAMANLFLESDHCVSEGRHLILGLSEQVQHQAQGRFLTYPGKLGKFMDSFFEQDGRIRLVHFIQACAMTQIYTQNAIRTNLTEIILTLYPL
jgi:hypothetical protein